MESSLKETFTYAVRGGLIGTVMAGVILVADHPQQTVNLETGLFIAGVAVVAGVLNALTKSL